MAGTPPGCGSRRMRSSSMTTAESVIAWVEEAYGVDLVSLELLGVGADQQAEKWRGRSRDGSSYAVKLSAGDRAVSLAVTAELAAQGLPGVIGPVLTTEGEVGARRDGRYLTLVPWIEGRRPLQTGMTAEHWRQFGAVLSGVHAGAIPDELAVRLPREDFVPARQLVLMDQVERLVASAEAAPHDDVTGSLVGAWRRAGSRLARIRSITRSLASGLRGRVAGTLLCHGDAHLGNLLLDEAGAVWLVDWDDARLATPEHDLMFVLGGGVLAFAPVTDTEQAWFLDGYGEVAIDGQLLQYARAVRAMEDLALWARDVLDESAKTSDDRTEALAIVRGILSPTGLLDRALDGGLL